MRNRGCVGSPHGVAVLSAALRRHGRQATALRPHPLQHAGRGRRAARSPGAQRSAVQTRAPRAVPHLYATPPLTHLTMAALPQVGAAWALITGERQAGVTSFCCFVCPCVSPVSRGSCSRLPRLAGLTGTSLARAMGRDAGVCGACQHHARPTHSAKRVSHGFLHSVRRRRAVCVPPVSLHAEPAAPAEHPSLGASHRPTCCHDAPSLCRHALTLLTHTRSCAQQHVSLAAGAITGGMGALFTVQPPRTAVAITLGSAACAALLDRIMSSDIVFT